MGGAGLCALRTRNPTWADGNGDLRIGWVIEPHTLAGPMDGQHGYVDDDQTMHPG